MPEPEKKPELTVTARRKAGVAVGAVLKPHSTMFSDAIREETAKRLEKMEDRSRRGLGPRPPNPDDIAGMHALVAEVTRFVMERREHLVARNRTAYGEAKLIVDTIEHDLVRGIPRERTMETVHRLYASGIGKALVDDRTYIRIPLLRWDEVDDEVEIIYSAVTMGWTLRLDDTAMPPIIERSKRVPETFVKEREVFGLRRVWRRALQEGNAGATAIIENAVPLFQAQMAWPLDVMIPADRLYELIMNIYTDTYLGGEFVGDFNAGFHAALLGGMMLPDRPDWKGLLNDMQILEDQHVPIWLKDEFIGNFRNWGSSRMVPVEGLLTRYYIDHPQKGIVACDIVETTKMIQTIYQVLAELESERRFRRRLLGELIGEKMKRVAASLEGRHPYRTAVGDAFLTRADYRDAYAADRWRRHDEDEPQRRRHYIRR